MPVLTLRKDKSACFWASSKEVQNSCSPKVFFCKFASSVMSVFAGVEIEGFQAPLAGPPP